MNRAVHQGQYMSSSFRHSTQSMLGASDEMDMVAYTSPRAEAVTQFCDRECRSWARLRVEFSDRCRCHKVHICAPDPWVFAMIAKPESGNVQRADGQCAMTSHLEASNVRATVNVLLLACSRKLSSQRHPLRQSDKLRSCDARCVTRSLWL